MNKEVQSIITTLKNTLNGEPWYGRSIESLLGEADTATVYIKPGETQHSLIELLYHMVTWATFTLKRLENDQERDIEKLDWRDIDPVEHTWEKGTAELQQTHNR